MMFQHSNNKKCFTIESLVGKEGTSHSGGSGDEPIRPTALRFPETLHPAAAAGVFGSCFQGSNGRTLFPDMVLQETGSHAQGPGGLPLHPLQIPPQSFFSPQHRDALSFYPWVLRSRYLGHRFQGERRTGSGPRTRSCPEKAFHAGLRSDLSLGDVSALMCTCAL